mgnify:CR=1 FL=1
MGLSKTMFGRITGSKTGQSGTSVCALARENHVCAFLVRKVIVCLRFVFLGQVYVCARARTIVWACLRAFAGAWRVRVSVKRKHALSNSFVMDLTLCVDVSDKQELSLRALFATVRARPRVLACACVVRACVCVPAFVAAVGMGARMDPSGRVYVGV